MVIGVDSIGSRILSIHRRLRAQFPGIGRVAVALHDEKTDALKTFVHSTEGTVPFERYECLLKDIPSLVEIARSGDVRVLSDLRIFAGSPHLHSRQLLERGYRSSYTMPFYDNERLCGFVFFDSEEADYFHPSVVNGLEVFAELISQIVVDSLLRARHLTNAVRVAADISQYRDPETGAHLDRMCRYARLIALTVAPDAGISEEFIEFLFLFAPLHDIGKVAIPDRILLKPTSLDRDEFEIMKSHTTKGLAIIDRIVADLDLAAFPHVQILRHLALSHHEMADGSGYPHGLAGDDIPVEARIVTVADVYDALTSERPYKPAWSQDVAFRYLDQNSKSRFDESCCRALMSRCGEAEEIRRHFLETDPTSVQSREGYSLDL